MIGVHTGIREERTLFGTRRQGMNRPERRGQSNHGQRAVFG